MCWCSQSQGAYVGWWTTHCVLIRGLSLVLRAIRVLDVPVLRLDFLDPTRIRRASQEPWRYRHREDCHHCSVREILEHRTRSSESHGFALLRSGLFGLFTFTMFGTHVRLILLNLTTVEQIRVQDVKEHVSATIAETYSMCAFAKKRRAKAQWDEEWGRPAIEGNIWWLGSGRKNWESVMGQSVCSWFREFRGSVVLRFTLTSSFSC